MLDAARWLRDNTKDDDAAAAFNAGIIGYYSGRRVVNLDGAVNNAAYAALRRKDLWGLMRRANVRHYLDFEPRTTAEFAPFFGDPKDAKRELLLNSLGRPETAWDGSHIAVVRIVWPGERAKEE